MRRKCGWCGVGMGRSEPLDDERLTHGICLACSERMLGVAGSHRAAARLRQTTAKGLDVREGKHAFRQSTDALSQARRQ